MASEPAAFTYPPTDAPRRHGPDGYADYRSYRPWLRDEFAFRCVYCLLRECWGNVTGQFDLDHFLPQVQAQDQPPRYDNLVYACHACNLRKHDEQLPSIRLTTEHVRVYEDGQLVGLTAEADRIIRLLYLNTPQSVAWRRLWIRTVQLAEEHDQQLLHQLLGFPEELPDLSTLKAPENTKPDGVGTSFHALRKRNELPSTYLF